MRSSNSLRTFTLISLLCASSAFAFTDLTTLGTTTFTVDTNFSTAPSSQTPTTLSLGVPFSSGQILAGDFNSTFDWSSEPGFALSLSSVTAPSASLFVEFQDSGFNPLATFNLGTGAVTSTPTSFNMTLVSGSIANLGAVASIEFNWSGSSLADDTAITVHAIQSVPEPSTYALLALGGATFGIYIFRRRRRA